MVTLNYQGRISNNFIQHIVANFLARKYNLEFTLDSPINEKFLPTNNGEVGKNFINVNDNNWIDLVFGDNQFESPHFHLSGFFNDRKFFEFFENDIKQNMVINYDESVSQNDLMVNYRIGELSGDRRMLPIEYYYEAIESTNFENGFITSDSLDHEFCVKLIDKYGLKPVRLNPADTISYCKNFNKLILSEGGYSWAIGFLSRAKEVICSSRHGLWHGDIYFERWKKLNWDYDPSTIVGRHGLDGYKPIRYDNPIGSV